MRKRPNSAKAHITESMRLAMGESPRKIRNLAIELASLVPSNPFYVSD